MCWLLVVRRPQSAASQTRKHQTASRHWMVAPTLQLARYRHSAHTMPARYYARSIHTMPARHILCPLDACSYTRTCRPCIRAILGPSYVHVKAHRQICTASSGGARSSLLAAGHTYGVVGSFPPRGGVQNVRAAALRRRGSCCRLGMQQHSQPSSRHPGIEAIKSLLDTSSSAEVAAALRAFDGDRDGVVTRAELRAGLEGLVARTGTGGRAQATVTLTVTDAMVDDIMESADPAHRGAIDTTDLARLAKLLGEVQQLRAEVARGSGAAAGGSLFSSRRPTLHMVTWNVGELDPSQLPTAAVAQILQVGSGGGEGGAAIPRPDIVVVCLQEIQMDAYGMVSSIVGADDQSQKGAGWRAKLSEVLSGYEPLVAGTSMMGLFLAVFALPQLAALASEVEVQKVATGMGLGIGIEKLTHEAAKMGKKAGLAGHDRRSIMGRMEGMFHDAAAGVANLAKAATPAAGNKGAIGARFVLMCPPPPATGAGGEQPLPPPPQQAISIAVVACHLAAGQKMAKKRDADLHDILCGLHWPDVSGSRTVGIDGTQVVLLGGDLNYRLDLDADAARAILEPCFDPAASQSTLQAQLASLQPVDQLTCHHRQGRALRGFDEAGALSFPPTYKFDIGTNSYDTSAKHRTPSWCDRIFVRGGAGCLAVPGSYLAHMHDPALWVSDHRPVSANFTLPALTQDGDIALLATALRTRPASRKQPCARRFPTFGIHFG
jgi:hypothetical protein